MNPKFKGKWALVTGSSRGIGQQVAIGLSGLGCNVILHGRQVEHTEQTRQLLDGYGNKVVAVGADLASDQGVDALVEGVQAVTDELDVLYNNAAINCQPRSVFDFSSTEWLDVFRVNVFAMASLCNAFGPGMKRRNWGRIVNVTSGIADQPQLAPYGVSKAAVDKLTKDLAFEFKDSLVRVNCIDPGWIKTDLGGPDAWEDVDSVLPGMLAPVLVSDTGSNGKLFEAQDYKVFRDHSSLKC